MNIYDFLKDKLVQKPAALNVDTVKSAIHDDTSKKMLARIGTNIGEVRKAIETQTLVIYERSQLYQSFDRSLEHPLMASATSLFADTATVRSQLHDSTVWVTAESKEYQYQIEKMLDVINLEETIFDWAWSVGTYGDLFVQVYGEPGIGLVSVKDDQHPINVSRLDYNGRLIGFYETPLGYSVADERKLLTPWDYVHFRLLGAKRRRPLFSDPMYTEYRTISIMAPDIRRLTSKYGTSVLADALPIYKRLKLAEDSILMARVSRGILRYIYKVKVGGANNEAIAALIDDYIVELKRARSLDTNQPNRNYQDRFSALAAMEDIILPVWDDVNDLAVEKIGDEVNIRWIADVEELRNQLACALRIPLSLLGGYVDDLPGSLGQSSLERLDIRFARQARRIQRAVISGLTRLAQIHLAYQGMDPDVNLFEIHMAETSSAEEEELKDALEKGVDVTDKLSDLVTKLLGEGNVNTRELLDYLNKKFLKLNDMDIEKLILKGNAQAFTREETPVPGVETPEEEGAPETEQPNPFKERASMSDFKSSVPINEKSIREWNDKWGKMKVKVEPITESK